MIGQLARKSSERFRKLCQKSVFYHLLLVVGCLFFIFDCELDMNSVLLFIGIRICDVFCMEGGYRLLNGEFVSLIASLTLAKSALYHLLPTGDIIIFFELFTTDLTYNARRPGILKHDYFLRHQEWCSESTCLGSREGLVIRALPTTTWSGFESRTRRYIYVA